MATRTLRQQFEDDGQGSITSVFGRRYSDSDRSDSSYHSYSTAPTDYGSVGTRPALLHHETCGGRLEDCRTGSAYYPSDELSYAAESRASIDTYASTVPSEEDPQEDAVEYHTSDSYPAAYHSEALPATPSDFAELFPSTRLLEIAHDDSTLDGNMNLRIDTRVEMSSGRMQDITLFHLRMYDLRKREFSLRRYDRDSGREVCHSVRKYQKSGADNRPSFQRSLSNALASLRTKPDNRMPHGSTLSRSDSGYESLQSFKGQPLDARPLSAGITSRTHPPVPTNTTKLEFSNYAQIEVKRRGTSSSKRYEFDYWGTSYFWRRVPQKDTPGKHVSYRLYSTESDRPLAHIEPKAMTDAKVREERNRGGWVPACSMWISDERLCQMQGDVSDVVVASGLIALVDDCIKRHFHSKQPRHLRIPVPSMKLDMEYVGPMRLINEVLKRPSTRGSTTSSRPTSRQTTKT